MARADTVTLLPISRYAQIMRMDRCHFNQVNGAKAPMRGGCDDVWDQQDREDLAWTIAQAEEMIAHELGFWPAPKWITGEEHRLGRIRSDWQNAELKTKWMYVQAFGTQQLTLVEADADVTYKNLKPDQWGREETAVIGDPAALYHYLSTLCTDPCDIRVYFREADGAWDSADPRWEIRPIKADVDGTILTITAESCMFVKPASWEVGKTDFDNGSTEWIIPFGTDELVDFVDVYCEGVNEAVPVTLFWEGICTCGTQCSHQTQGACAYVTDWERGHFAPRPATWDGANHQWTAATYADPPVKITVDYLAGYPLNERTCRMHPILERAVVKLTNVLLPEPPCGYCDAAETIWKRDRQPIDPLTPEAASMPWDLYSQGALEVFRIVKRFSRTAGGSVRGCRWLTGCRKR